MLVTNLALESDRGCVLVAAAAIDEAIVGLLKVYFKKVSAPQDTEKEVHFLLKKQPVPPIGSYGVRVTLCYALGLVDADLYATLKRLGDVRNSFAHIAEPAKITLDNMPPISGRLRSFVQVFSRVFDPLFQHWQPLGDAKEFSPERLQFMHAMANLYHFIGVL